MPEKEFSTRSDRSSIDDSATLGDWTYNNVADDFSLGPGGGLETVVSKVHYDDRSYFEPVRHAPAGKRYNTRSDGFSCDDSVYDIASSTLEKVPWENNEYMMSGGPPTTKVSPKLPDKSAIALDKRDLPPESWRPNENKPKTHNLRAPDSKTQTPSRNKVGRFQRPVDDAADEADEEGNLILHHACMWGANADLIKELLRENPQGVRVRNKRGETPLDILRKDPLKSYIVAIIETFEREQRAKVLPKESNHPNQARGPTACVKKSSTPPESACNSSTPSSSEGYLPSNFSQQKMPAKPESPVSSALPTKPYFLRDSESISTGITTESVKKAKSLVTENVELKDQVEYLTYQLNLVLAKIGAEGQDIVMENVKTRRLVAM